MQLPPGDVRTSAQLADYTLDRLRDGYLRASGDPVQQPIIAFLDELALQRSDWHPAIAVTLHHLAQTGGKNAITALLQFLSSGLSGPAFLATAEDILDTHGDLRSKTSVGIYPRQGLRRLSKTVSALQKQAKYYAGPQLSVVFMPPQPGVYSINTESELVAAAHASIGRAPVEFGVKIQLAWLRRFAFFVPRVAGHVPAVLRALAKSGEPSQVAAVGEYAVLAGDPMALSNHYADWLDEGCPWLDVAGPSPHPMVDGQPLALILQQALRLGRQQRETGPTDVTLH